MDDISRPKGGRLGWISIDFQKGGKQYAAESYDLEPGSISDPIDTGEGFWITKLLEKMPEGKFIDDFVFNLEPGQVSPPLLYLGNYYLFKLGEKQERALQDDHRQILAQKALKNWLKKSATKGSEEGWIKWNWGSELLNWALDHV